MNKLIIKNMVCDRCILLVKRELKNQNIKFINIKLGEVTLLKELNKDKKSKLDFTLKNLGFQIIDNKKNQITEKIKTVIIELIHKNENELKIKLSKILSEKLNYDYQYLSNIFSEIENTSIEKYFIVQKIEKVKELLLYNELTLSEIAYQLNYSNVAYLSRQFKNITNMTTSEYKKQNDNTRLSLDKV